ncbi:LytTR family DNA-binding domain-containing protein [Pontixanthobacter sp. CEM42]|uniref:LytTR family DNA-binding domain-containing protein n=1 Tax=Pontixanthobacter sp. CEM42 TaxID=2792077 RepID=UPI001ADFCA27|nr:LytTR family DNA-binding domain-containing protein [Pontixanthobacter sp. CEM42]
MKMGEYLQPTKRISDRAFDAIACVLVFAAYLVVFAVVNRESTFLKLALSSLSNLAPMVLLTVAVRPAIRRWLIDAPILRQCTGHVALAALFSFAWHWLILVLVGMRDGGSLTEFTVRAFFPEPALAWQFLQGVTIYALVASLTYMRAQPDLPSSADGEAEGWREAEPTLERYFIRLGEDIKPIDVSKVIMILGADDYAEVITAEGKHLVRTTLSKFEASLDPEQFLRIHRSRIVNVHKIEHAEPSGDGRLVLQMENGERIKTSRAGAKALRDRVL